LRHSGRFYTRQILLPFVEFSIISSEKVGVAVVEGFTAQKADLCKFGAFDYLCTDVLLKKPINFSRSSGYALSPNNVYLAPYTSYK